MALSAAAASAPIFVLNSLDANVSIVDPVSYKELRRVPTGKEPHHLYLTPDEKSLMVANATGNTITMMDPKTGEVQRTLTDIVDPYQLQFSPDMKWFVTAANRLDHIDIYAWQPQQKGAELKLVKRVQAGKTPSHIMIDKTSTTAYVTLQDSDQLIAIDLATQTPKWTVSVGKTPADVFLTPDQKTLLVALTGDSFVEAYDVSKGPAKLVKRIPTAAGAHAFRAQGDKRHLFVSNRTANSISRIDMLSLTVTDTFAVPGGPDCMDVLADGKTLLVTSRWARKLTVVDLEQKKVVNQVPVGKSPHGVWTLNHAPTR
ncbi:MAG: beta-propeller fold lactonase family protein [Achromobacter sp.]|nr:MULTISPECIES: beta-propeller fold lactonase family protein [Achromobacter]MDX3988025.1 beta-propeller fold lactonase family protein [Achromobacter sp.]QYJ24386.1 beta-propeller fold lactonase family protein [Achromobacter sp. ES-001]